MSGPGKPSGLMLQWYPQLTSQAPGTSPSPPPHGVSPASEYSLVKFSLFSTLQSLYPLPPPNILIETQGILEVKGPHPVSSVCPLHSTDGETETQSGCALPRVIQSVSGSTGLRPRSPESHSIPPALWVACPSVGLLQGLPVRGGHEVGGKAVGQLIAV